MSIYIRGMRPPKSCSDCPLLDFVVNDTIKCMVTGEHFEAGEKIRTRRSESCPMTEVPAHGRLSEGATDHNRSGWSETAEITTKGAGE